MADSISRIIAELEENQQQNLTNPRTHLSQSSSPSLLSQSTLLDLQSLVDTNDPDIIDQFYGDLSSKNLSPTSLLPPMSVAMDSGPTHLSLLSSSVYLSILLAPNSPVFTLFTPMAFLSLLRSIRRSLKHRPSPAVPREESTTGRNSRGPPPNRKKRSRGSRSVVRDLETGTGDENEEREFDVRVLFSVLEKLESVLGLVHLDRFPDCLKSLVQTMCEIPVTAVEFYGVSASFSRLVDMSSRILGKILGSEHGDPASTAGEVLKSLTSSILLSKSPARSFALGFVSKKMMVLSKESAGVKKAIVNLPKYLANKAPEKAEPRGYAVEAIMEIVKAMEFDDQIGFVQHVVKMTQGKVSLRLLAVDLIPLLVMALKGSLEEELDNEGSHSWKLACLQAIIERCGDSTAGIRARALSNLTQVAGFLSSDEKNREVLKEAIAFTGNHSNEGINDLLRKRCADEKAAVRKAALLLVTKLTTTLGGSFDDVLLKMMGIACSDPLVSIRKAAISALSEAFRTFSNESVTIEWLHSVPRLIADNESSIQEECENLFLELILERVSRAGSAVSPWNTSLSSDSNVKEKSFNKEIGSIFPVGTLVLLKQICNGEVTPWVKKICTQLGKKKRLKPRIVDALQNIIKTSESLWLSYSLPIEKWTAPPGAWFLLSELSAYLPKAVDWEFLLHHWQLLDKNGGQDELRSPLVQGDPHENGKCLEIDSVAWAGDRVFLLQTISYVSVELPAELAADLAHNMLKRIEEFNMHSTEVNAHVKALRTLCKQKSVNIEEAGILVMKWAERLISKASKILEKYISESTEYNKDSSFFTPPTSGIKKAKRSATISTSLSETVTAVYTIGCLVIVCPSADISSIIPLLHTIITSANSDPKSKRIPVPALSLKRTAPSLYIQAWLTMGKICLVDGKLAKRYIPLFVQELEKSDCAMLRNNLVVTMADFCVRYTALVDCYITKITKCLRDPCELVRRQTFLLLSRLLQRDYVKWRGVLFLRFLLSLVDESKKIRQLADFLFANILKAKAPLLAYNSFVEAIYVLNDCHADNGHPNPKGSQTENRAFSIRGNDESSRSKRMHIYVTLLKQMASEHLLATFAKLCAEILAATSDGMLNIEDVTGQSVLQDAFQILSCKEIRISPSRGSASETADLDEEGGEGGTCAAAAKGRAITQAVRRGLIQNTIPIFIELKRLLESKNSPLIGSLMECLRILLKDYKNEIDDILVADKQLQKELIYDIQKYEAAKTKSTVQSTIFRSPNVSKVGSGNKLQDSKVASEMAAAAIAKSVLREVNKGTPTPPLSSISVPKLKSNQEGTSGRNHHRPIGVLESLRRRQSFNSDDEN